MCRQVFTLLNKVMCVCMGVCLCAQGCYLHAQRAFPCPLFQSFYLCVCVSVCCLGTIQNCVCWPNLPV